MVPPPPLKTRPVYFSNRFFPGFYGIVIGLGGLALFLAGQFFPGAVELVYGRFFYPGMVEVLAFLSAKVPASLAEWSFLIVGVLVLLAFPRGYRRSREKDRGIGVSLLFGALLLLGRIGMIWSLFLVLWGFNYARPLPVQQFQLKPPPSAEDTKKIIAAIEQRLDQLRAQLPEDRDGVVAPIPVFSELDGHLRDLQSQALTAAGMPAVDAGRTKRFLISPLLLRWGVAGVYGPFTAEPNVVWPTGPALGPFTVAHERAHLSGQATEEGASFVGYLTCWRSPRPEVRYAAWLHLFLELRRDPSPRHPGVKRDILALANFIERYRGKEAPMVWKAYSGYLQAHGVKGGTHSYQRAAGLALRWLGEHGLPKEPAPLPKPWAPGIPQPEPGKQLGPIKP